MRVSLLTSSLAAAAAVVATVAPAHAAGQDGTPNSGEFVFYFNSFQGGSLSDFASNKTDLLGYDFLTSGNGSGEPVKNNAASVANLKNQGARVYYNSGYAGISDYVNPLSERNLVDTKNENASFRWV